MSCTGAQVAPGTTEAQGDGAGFLAGAGSLRPQMVIIRQMADA